MKCLIKAIGWIGDALFAQALPEKLKKELGYQRVDLITYRPQPFYLLATHPFIDNVYLTEAPDETIYDKVFTMPEVHNKCIPQTIQWQKICGIKNTSSEFYTETLSGYDTSASIFLSTLDKSKPLVSYQGDWQERRWAYSKEQYDNGDVNNHGDIPKLIQDLKNLNKYNLIEISPHYSANVDARGCCLDPNRYALLASIIKKCDYFLGCEGGATNLAASLHTKCITTMCHVYKYYGPKGFSFKNDEPLAYGPEQLFPDQGHVNLDPFITDEEILNKIIKTINI